MTRALVGWLLIEDAASVVYFPPERLAWPEKRTGGATDCPAVADLARHFYLIRSPVTLSLRCNRLEPGREFFYDVVPCEGEKVLAGRSLQRLLSVTPPKIWEDPRHPTLQLNLPYVFVSDESVYLEQYPAFFSPGGPYLTYGGRFPIDVWPRQVNFSFQWTDVARDILIRRGDPLFYLRFQPAERDRKVDLVEAERTRELESFLASVRGVTGLVDKTFGLFGRAAELRPPRLVVPKESYKPN